MVGTINVASHMQINFCPVCQGYSLSILPHCPGQKSADLRILKASQQNELGQRQLGQLKSGSMNLTDPYESQSGYEGYSILNRLWTDKHILVFH